VGSLHVSRLLSLAAVCAAAVAWAASGSAEPAQPAAVLTQATGDLHLTNSQDGHAIFRATGLAPGGSVSGTVRLQNSGSLPGDLTLAQSDVSDQPGANGGRLSDVVKLDVSDVTAGSSVPVFTGRLAGFGSRSLGALGPAESRTFRFTATLPDGGLPPSAGGGDNAFAGSGLTARYAWTATATGTGPTPSGDPVVKIRVRAKKLVRRGFLDVMVRCDVACRVSAYAQLPKPKRAKRAPRTKRRSATLTVPNKTARIRLKLSRKAKRRLHTALTKRKRVKVKVKVGVRAASGGPSKAYTRKLKVKRQKVTRRVRRR
jgi:spore coat-associated protein N